jgi:hypothetical protein
MSYVHTGNKPVTFSSNPIDPDSTDWIFFSYQDWLRTGEAIIAHSALIEGGEIVTNSVLLGTMTIDGTEFSDVYGVQVKAATNSLVVVLTHRKSTTTTGAIDLGRLNMDHTVRIPVKQL